MSDKSTGENGNELSEMQRVTLLLEEAGSDPLAVPVADRVSAKVLTQPAQSPDVNVNDCAFFSSLQAQIMKQVAMDLIVPMEDYHECVRLVREYRRAHPLE